MLYRTVFTRVALLGALAASFGIACGATPAPGTGGAGGTGGSAGSAGTGAGGALPSEDSLTRLGPYPVGVYENGLPDSPSYGPSTMYHPDGNAPAPYPALAVAPGFLEERAIFENWGRFLASHGFILLTFNTNTTNDLPDLRATALASAITTIRNENTRAGSPLNGKVDLNRLGIMGHSMGGGGALIAATRISGLRAVIAMHPWNLTPVTGVRVPTLVFGAQGDTIAPAAQHAWPLYGAVSATKAYLEFAGPQALPAHFIANNPLYEQPDNRVVARSGLAWLHAHMNGDTRYLQFVRNESNLSRYDDNF